MKSCSIIFLAILSFLTFSCSDDLTDIGTGIQPSADQIKIGADTLHVTTENIFVESIFTRQDSFLLGSFYDTKYGTTQAEILAQVNCPIGFKFPPSSVPDSAKVILYYSTWFGDSYSPVDVNIYEINKKTFQYSTPYPSNLNPEEYTDKSQLLGHKVFTAKDAMGIDSTYMDFKLSADFVKRFFPDITKAYYINETDFTNNIFKGLYIKANFGAATMLNVQRVDLEYYYHYTYKKNGKDTVANNVLTFPANSEVRQVNRFLHPDRNSVVNIPDSVNYLSSPANIQTNVKIPLKQIKDKMETKVSNKKLSVNSAILQVEATEIDDATLAQPLLSYVLLIKESSMDRFFNKNELPSDTCAILATITKEQISTGVYQYYYSYNLSALIENETKIAKTRNSMLPESLNMRLVPVRVKTTTSSSGISSISEVKHQFLMGATTVRSGKNAYSPMRINIIYSGF